MSERRTGPGEGRLPLPSPRSPQELDDKILAYARDNAPGKKPFLQPRWVAGLATASVVAVALFITEPQQQAPKFSAPAPALEEDMSPGAARTQTVKAKSKTQPGAPAAPMNMSRSAGQATRLGEHEVRADEPLLKQEIAADAMTVGAINDVDRSGNSAQPPELTAVAKTSTSFTREELRDKVQHYADLVAQGEGEQARADYRQLRLACPDCALPETLAQAIATLAETGPQ